MSIETIVLNLMDLNIHVTWKKLQRTTMLGSIPHQKFILYHFPTRGRAGVKLGNAWYVSNVSIIFDGFMLLSCQTLDVLHAFYIFFGTNLLTQCQVPVPVFFHVFDPFHRRILKGVQTEWNCQKDFFPNRKRSGSRRNRAGGLQGPHKPSWRGQGARATLACGLLVQPLP